MRPDNRYAHRSLAQLVMAKAVLVVVCRRCKHQTVLYPLEFIPRFGKDYLAINLRSRMRCTACRGIGTAHMHEAVRRPEQVLFLEAFLHDVHSCGG